MLHVGHRNYVARSKITAISEAETAPGRRVIENARMENKLITLSAGRERHSIIFLSSGHIAVSSMTTDTLAKRWRDEK